MIRLSSVWFLFFSFIASVGGGQSLSDADKQAITDFLATCQPNGAAAAGTAKAKENELKARDPAPGAYQPITLTRLRRLDYAASNPFSADELAKLRSGSKQVGIDLVGYLYSAKPGGCEDRHDPAKNGESCNCHATTPLLCDTHIDLILNQGEGPNEKKHVIVEVTPRSRLRIADQANYSTDALKQRFEGKNVRVKGWLFFDPDHVCESASTYKTKGCSSTKPPWRATAWEIHPVLTIEETSDSPK